MSAQPWNVTPVSDMRLSRRSQSWHFERIWEVETGDTVRITIHRDAYDRQSYGRAEVFSPAGKKWNLIVSRAARELATCESDSLRRPLISYTQAELNAEDGQLFLDDEAALLDEARTILGVRR